MPPDAFNKKGSLDINPEEVLQNPKVVQPESTEKPHNKLKALRTYQGDMEETIVNTKASIATVAIAESKRKYEKPQTIEIFPEKNNRSLAILAGIVLILLGVVIFAFVYLSRNKSPQAVYINSDTILKYTTVNNLSVAELNRNFIISNILSQKKSWNGTVNQILYLRVKNIAPNASTTDVSKIMSLLGPGAPDSLLRSLSPNYMIGIYAYDTNEPFIILTTSDFGRSFEGMISWEKNMVDDLGPIFSISATSTNSYVFVDDSIKNKDFRKAEDSYKKTAFLYSFIDNNTIVITKNESILGALINKFNTDKLVR